MNLKLILISIVSLLLGLMTCSVLEISNEPNSHVSVLSCSDTDFNESKTDETANFIPHEPSNLTLSDCEANESKTEEITQFNVKSIPPKQKTTRINSPAKIKFSMPTIDTRSMFGGLLFFIMCLCVNNVGAYKRYDNLTGLKYRHYHYRHEQALFSLKTSEEEFSPQDYNNILID